MRTLLFQLQGELWKLFARKRTYMGFIVFALLQVALYFIIHWLGYEQVLRNMITMQGQAFEQYFSALTIGHTITSLSVFLIGALFVTLVSGDIVAKESEDGNMRMLLVRPISRVRLLGLKYFACVIYTFVLVQFAAYAAAVVGVVIRGWGTGLFVLAPDGSVGFFNNDESLHRYALASAVLGLGMTTIGSIGFFLSCLKIKPASATIGALSYALIDFIVHQGNLMRDHQQYLISTHISTWGRVFMEEIPWVVLARSFTILAAVNLSLFILGAAIFQSRDLKS